MTDFSVKYLITDKNEMIYTVEVIDETGVLIEIANVEELNAALFLEYGMDDIPTTELLNSLINPGILYWQDSESELPVIWLNLLALPTNQTVFTENVSMIDRTITGIEKVVIDADENTLFAMSFDAGITWLTYVNNDWSTLSEEQSGMSKVAFDEIGTDAWARIATTGQYMFRFVLAEGGFVNKITIHYLNEWREGE